MADKSNRKAIKVIDKESLKTNKQRWRISNEIRLHTKCAKHRNIVEFCEHYENEEAVFMVMELCSGGELFEQIVERGRFPENEGKRLMTDILEAVDYLHMLDIVHRDLKPENLLFSTSNPNAPLKLCDFGLAKELGVDLNQGRNFLKASTSGTTAYCAPERLAKDNESKAVDIWSAGCILYFLLYGVPPFHSEKEDEEDAEDEVFTSIEEGRLTFPSDIAISDEAKDLIKKLLEPNLYKRITAAQALNHPWIKSLSSKNDSSKSSHNSSQGKLTASSLYTIEDKTSLKMSINKAIDIQKEQNDNHLEEAKPHNGVR